MLKRLFLGILAVTFSVLVGMSPVAASEDFQLTPLDYDFPYEIEAAAEEGKNIVVMFHRNGCPYCDKMRKRIFPHPKVSAFYNDNFYLIEVNMRGDLDVVTPEGEDMSEKDWAGKMGVRATPVLAFFSKDAKQALRLTGYQDPEMFLAAGRYVSSEAFNDGTSFLKFVRAGR